MEQDKNNTEDSLVKDSEAGNIEPEQVSKEFIRREPALSEVIATGEESTETKELPKEGKNAALTQEELLRKMRKQVRKSRIATWIIFVMFIALAAGFLLLLKQKDTKPEKAETTPPPVKNRILDENAAEHAKQYTTDACKITVEEILGWEYVTFSYSNGFQLKVRNEYPGNDSEQSEMAVLICNEDGLRESFNNISMNNVWDIAEQTPVLYGETLYLYFRNDDGTYGFINMATLEEAVSVKPEEVAASYFELTDNGEDYVGVKAGKAEYTFHSKTHKVSFAPFSFVEEEDGTLTVSAPVCLGDSEFIGYLDGRIVPDGGTFAFTDTKFGAYVGMNYEDPQSTKIIEPISVALDNPIVLSGADSARYYLPRFENVPFHNYDWTGLVFEENGFRTLKDADGNVISKMGIDVSKYNDDIDWEQVKAAGIDFAIVRVGYRGVSQGSLDEDPYAEANLVGASEAGLDLGVYFYTQAINEKEAVEEAEFVLDILAKYEITPTMPIVIDTELYESKKTARGNMLSREERTKCLQAFCKTIVDAGYTPMVYASTRWSILNYDRDALADYPFWFAYYGDTVSYRFDFDIWQYTSTGKVPGIEGDVDLNIMVDTSVIEKP